jgi:plastocyanin
LFLMACGSSSSTTGTGGATGSGGASASGGATGSGGASGTGGAAAAFTAVNPCNLATDYATAADNTIAFGGPNLVYAPKCLKVAAGAMVTFKGMGTETFSDHPLAPSTTRGTLSGNPITNVADMSATKTFTFPTPGYYA